MRVFYGDRFLQKAHDRGVSLDEVLATLERGRQDEAHSGRLARRRVFPFDGTWQGRYFHQKEVRVIYVQDPDDTIVLISVIARYGSFP